MLAEAARRYPMWIELDLRLVNRGFVQAVETFLVEGQVDDR